MSTLDYTPVILAGGRSLRMGSNKAWALHKGKPLIEHMIDLVKTLEKEPIISGSIVDFQNLELSVVEDLMSNQGPLGALYSILRSIQTDYALVLPCDCPDIKTSSLFRIIEQADGEATVARDEVHIHPLIGLYHRSCLTQIEEALKKEQRSMHRFLDRINVHYVSFPDPSEFSNLNYPHQLLP